MKLTAGTYFGNNVNQVISGGLILTEKIHNISQEVPEHFHENAYFCLGLNGGWKEFVNGKEYECSAYDLVYHPAGEVHRTSFSKASFTRTFNIELSPGLLETLSPLLENTSLQRHLSKINKAPNPILRIYKEFHSNDAYSPLAIEAALLEKVVEMARSNKLSSTSKNMDWVEDVKRLVSGTYQAPLTLQEIAKQVHMHPAQLSRDFHKKMGCTLSEYYRRCRLQHACQFLKDTHLTLVQVALETGYYDQSHMCRDFQTYLHTSPLQYRKR